MPEESVIHAFVTETGKSPYAVNVEVSGYTLAGDEPPPTGGGTGPAPYDMLLAALGECTAMTVRWYAIRKNWPLDKVEVKLTHRKEDKKDIFTKHVTLRGDTLSEAQRLKLIEIAGKCPIQRTLEGTPVIQMT
jgi:putative redox protein